MQKNNSCSKALIMLTSLLFAVALVPCTQGVGVSFIIYGLVFDTNGTIPLSSVTMKIPNLETGSLLDPVVPGSDGVYAVNLGNLKPNETHNVGDNIQIVANYAGKTNYT